MTDKILFWVDLGITHFGIAKYLQKKYNCELYAIYDLNPKLKLEFQNQTIVDFEKVWFFWDYVSRSTNTPDLNYLKSFEEKYKINLWKLAYDDRNLFKFNPYHKFDKNEILLITEKTCKFFELILNEIKPNFLVIRVTDFHRNHLLVELCKAKKIKVLMLMESRLGFRASIGTEFTKIDESWNMDTQENNVKDISDLKKYLDKHNRFKQTKNQISSGIGYSFLKKVKASLNWLHNTWDSEYNDMYIHYGVSPFTAFKDVLVTGLRRKFRKRFIDRYFVQNFSHHQKFIFYPLQVEPERTVSFDVFFSNQIEIIKNIAKSLPIEYKLYVKEHYNMIFRGWRSISVYRELMDLPNVKLLHPSVSPSDVLDNCSMTITLSSTAGLDAAFHNKPSIVLSDVMYSVLPSVYKLKTWDELPMKIRSMLNMKVDNLDLVQFVNLIENNTFSFDLFDHYNEITKHFHHSGFITNDDLTIKEIDSFIESNKEIFEFLASEYLKKINQYNALKHN
jgi:hypothetical protein